MVFYGYGPHCKGWKAGRAAALAQNMEAVLQAVRTEVKEGMAAWLKDAWPEGVKPANAQPTGEWWPGDWPYIQADGPHGGPALRRITHLPDVVSEELVKRCDAAYKRIMGVA